MITNHRKGHMSISLYGDNAIFLLSPPIPTPERRAQGSGREFDHTPITLQSSLG